MNEFAIISDSTCDLGAELRERYDIDYIKMSYVVDGVTYPASLDWESHSACEFYDLMREGRRATTVQITRTEALDTFRKYLDAGLDIVYVACSSALSGSYGFASLLAKELKEKYPEREIYCVDSLRGSLGQGLLAIKAAEMKENGATAKEVADWLCSNRLRSNQYGTVDTLEYLRRAGRVAASSAFFGNLFGVKPIIMADTKGQNYAFKKVKGTAASYREIAQLICDACEDSESSTLYISHGDAPDTAEALKNEIFAIRPFKEVYVNHIGPVVGASVGPGTIIAYCFGKEVTVEGK